MSIVTHFKRNEELHLNFLNRIKKRLPIEEYIFPKEIFDVHYKDDIYIRRIVELGLLKEMVILIKHGANVHIYNGILLQIAVKNNNFEITKILLESINPDVLDGYCLQLACQQGFVSMVDLLVKAGAKLNIDKAILAAAEKGHLWIVKLLISKYHIKNMTNEIIIEAIKFDQLRIIKEYLYEITYEMIQTIIQYNRNNIIEFLIEQYFLFDIKLYHYAFSMKKFDILNLMINYRNPFFIRDIRRNENYCIKKILNCRLYFMDEMGMCHYYNPIEFKCQICKKQCLEQVFEQQMKSFEPQNFDGTH